MHAIFVITEGILGIAIILILGFFAIQSFRMRDPVGLVIWIVFELLAVLGTAGSVYIVYLTT